MTLELRRSSGDGGAIGVSKRIRSLAETTRSAGTMATTA